MTRTIVFLHGAWVTPLCWEKFIPFFEARGYRCVAPAWPGKDRPIEAIRADPSPLAGLGVGEIVDHYDQLIRAMDEPPILIGHSFGGLVVQLLLSRGLGSAAVAVNPCPPPGLLPTPRALLSALPVLLRWRGWRPTKVDFARADRAPLLIIAGERDWIAPLATVRANHRAYRRSQAITALREFPKRSHWSIAEPGWEEVARYALDWVRAHTKLPPWAR